MEQIWPPKSPDMSPLDYWFWGACEQHIKESKPQNIDNDYARNIPRQVVFKAAKDIYIRTGCCLDNGGGAFENKLKLYKRNK